MLQYKKYYMPRSKEELFTLMEENRNSFEILSGGTDLYAKEKTPFHGKDVVIDISSIKDFSGMELNENSITIGAAARIQQFLEEPEFIENVPILRHAACYFADRQIREMATLGGNLANASPCGDMIPPLLAIDAMIHTVMKNEDGICKRDIPMSGLVQGVGRTSLSEGEVIESVSCPILKEYGCAFKKVGLRRSLCISTVNAAFLVKADKTKKYFEDIRIAFGGIAPTPARFKEIEESLRGELITKEVIHKMVDLIPGDIVRSRSRKEYRRTVVRNFLLAGLYEALAEIDIVLR